MVLVPSIRIDVRTYQFSPSWAGTLSIRLNTCKWTGHAWSANRWVWDRATSTGEMYDHRPMAIGTFYGLLGRRLRWESYRPQWCWTRSYWLRPGSSGESLTMWGSPWSCEIDQKRSYQFCSTSGNQDWHVYQLCTMIVPATRLYDNSERSAIRCA